MSVKSRHKPQSPAASTAKSPAARSDDAPSPKRDVVLVHGVSEQGDAYHVLRAREDRVEAGVVRPVREGQPAHGEIVSLTPRKDAPLLYDVDVHVPAPRHPSGDASRGPAQVASDPYRENWDRIWRKGRKRSLPN